VCQNKWEQKKWNGPVQFANPQGDLMMLPADMSLLSDPSFRSYVELYAKDEKAFFADFSSAWTKLTENGVNFGSASAGPCSNCDKQSTVRAAVLIGALALAASAAK